MMMPFSYLILLSAVEEFEDEGERMNKMELAKAEVPRDE